MQDKIRFGPAGGSDSFYEEGHKSSLEMPEWLNKLGLNAFEYQCGRGVKISDESAKRLGELAIDKGVGLSIHAPYYINISTTETEKYKNGIAYIMQTLHAAKVMRANRIVIHMGTFKGSSREKAMERSKVFIKDALAHAEEYGYEDIHLCLETMGKINQMGTLDEVLELCSVDEKILPAIDFGHLNARGFGCIKNENDYKNILDEIENKLGFNRLKIMHCHFSKIKFTQKGGEVKHLNFDDGEYGPDFEPLAEQIVKRRLTPVLICESAGKQAEDAMKMKQIYNNAMEK